MNLHRMKTIEDPYWEQAWEIYRENFPEGERRRLFDQERMLLDERYYCTAILERGVVRGILFHWKIDGFLFVEHLAIHQRSKGRGIGTRILEKVKKMPEKLILEIDPPEDAVSIRRKRFYERAGLVLNPYDHQNLPVRIGQEGIPLRVMTFGAPLCEVEYSLFRKRLMTDLIQYGEGYRKGGTHGRTA